MLLLHYFKRCISLLPFYILALFSGCQPNISAEVKEDFSQIPDQIDFNFHIKPILSDRCFACHGPDENNQKAGLRLDIPEEAFAELSETEGKFAIFPGKISKSEVYRRIFSEDPEQLMPPPESHLSLTEREKAMITRWIEQGAEYKPHWSFVSPVKPKVPKPKLKAWVNNDVDAFILDKIEEKSWEPNEEADKFTLIRRLSLDLTGLPPTPEEVVAFTKDESENAYNKLVERLLASSHYGEHMAVDWLDLARYADSHGYQDDGLRNVWPWRDWVIKAFNQNVPYDSFLIWQLAGDLLPHPTKDQLLATAFNRHHMQSQEGGIVEEEYRAQNVHDRVKTVTKAFMGLTVECAQCHDHKYDPISQKEYYQLYSFFNQVEEYGQIPYVGTPSPSMVLTDERVDSILSRIQEKIDQHEPKLDYQSELYSSDFNAWIQEASVDEISDEGLLAHFPFEKKSGKSYNNSVQKNYKAVVGLANSDTPPQSINAKKGKGLEFVGESFIELTDSLGWFERNEAFSISLWLNILNEEAEGPIFSRSGGLMNGNRGYDCFLQEDHTLKVSMNQVWPDNSIEIETLNPLIINEWNLLTITYDGSSKAKGLSIFINDEKVKSRVLHDNLYQSIKFAKGYNNWGAAPFRLGRLAEKSIEGIAVDELKLYNRDLSAIEVIRLSGNTDKLKHIFDRSTVEDDLKQEVLLREYFVKTKASRYEFWADSISLFRGKINSIVTQLPSVMVTKDRVIPRPTFILDRGEYDAPTKVVFPGTPSRIKPFLNEERPDRLGLAKWLLAPDHPLTSRVTVNRIWQKFFGKGIVKTSDDFGNQGNLPTHPELLDYLAIYFMEHQWNVKDLIRLIVHSSTYKQSSIVEESIYMKDPDNELYARGSSFRLSAEMVRDHALASSGLLNDTIGGPSVKPYQPPGLWKELATRNATVYEQDHGDDLYRRSMYTIWKRTSPPPMMINFDAATRNFCEVRRQKTSTPLQALVLLNDPQFIEACRVLAARVIEESPYQLEDWVERLFLYLTARFPNENEMFIATSLFQEELSYLQKDPLEVEELLCIGESINAHSSTGPVLGALTMVTNMIMNTDAFVIKR